MQVVRRDETMRRSGTFTWPKLPSVRFNSNILRLDEMKALSPTEVIASIEYPNPEGMLRKRSLRSRLPLRSSRLNPYFDTTSIELPLHFEIPVTPDRKTESLGYMPIRLNERVVELMENIPLGVEITIPFSS
jgi:hypothetical protein